MLVWGAMVTQWSERQVLFAVTLKLVLNSLPSISSSSHAPESLQHYWHCLPSTFHLHSTSDNIPHSTGASPPHTHPKGSIRCVWIYSIGWVWPKLFVRVGVKFKALFKKLLKSGLTCASFLNLSPPGPHPHLYGPWYFLCSWHMWGQRNFLRMLYY